MSEAPSSLFGLSKNAVVAASLAGAAFVGYCIYFDHKRRTAPDYKEKLRQSVFFSTLSFTF